MFNFKVKLNVQRMVGLFYFFEIILHLSIVFLKASLFNSTIFSIISRDLSKYSPEKLCQCFPQLSIWLYAFRIWFLNSLLQICLVLPQPLVSSAQIYCNYFSQWNPSTLNFYLFLFFILPSQFFLLVLSREEQDEQKIFSSICSEFAISEV